MEDNHRPELPSVFSDLDAPVDFRNELTRRNSDSSALSADDSKETLHHHANAGLCTEWTNAKHSLYLDSLEASFVKQLQQSRVCSDRNTRDSNLFQKLPASTCDSSGAFLVIRDGCWKRINFRSNQPASDNAADSHFILDSQWVRHFRCTEKGRSSIEPVLQHHNTTCNERMLPRGKRALSHRFLTSQDQLPVCPRYHQELVGSITEVSDQNFVDENREEQLRSLSFAKRLKKVAAEASSKDQIWEVSENGKFNCR